MEDLRLILGTHAGNKHGPVLPARVRNTDNDDLLVCLFVFVKLSVALHNVPKREPVVSCK